MGADADQVRNAEHRRMSHKERREPKEPAVELVLLVFSAARSPTSGFACTLMNEGLAAFWFLAHLSSMSTVQEIENAIQQLPESEVRTLAQWLDDYAERQWDKRIETDVASGSLAALADEARAARANGPFRRFP